MPSCFLLWDKDETHLPLSDAHAPLIREAFAALADGRTQLSEFPKETLLSLRQQLADTQTGAEVVLRVIGQMPQLYLADSTPIEAFDLSVRSSNCLKAASIETLEDLLDWTPERLMELANFGRKCLNEISELLKRSGYGAFDEKNRLCSVQKALRWKSEAAPLAFLLDVRRFVSAEAVIVRMNGFGWHSLADIAVHSLGEVASLSAMTEAETTSFQEKLDRLALRIPITLPLWFVQYANVLRDAFRVELEQLTTTLTGGEGVLFETFANEPSATLDEELLRLIPSRYDDRKRSIVMSLLGFGARELMTLDEVAANQNPPMTRERIRQIALPVTEAFGDTARKWPQLRRAMEFLRLAAPCRVETVQQALIENRILASPISLVTIMRLARRAGVTMDLEVKGPWLLSPDTSALLDSLMHAVGKLSSRWGAAYWPDVLSSSAQEIAPELKDLLPSIVWLDQPKQYAVLPTRENSLANRLALILKVTPRLRLIDAYQGAFRDSRMMHRPLPEEHFKAFCEVWPWCTVEDDKLVAGQGMPPSEASVDDLLVLVLREIGRPVRRRELMKEASKHGLKTEQLAQALSYSNVIAYANGFFAVLGDSSLAHYAEGLLKPEPETMVVAPVHDEAGIVPNEHDAQFAPLLMAAVEARLAALDLSAPWSVSDLGLTDRDRHSLIAWGRTAAWDFGDDAGFYELGTREKVSKRTALGLAFVLFAAEAVRRSEDPGSVWPGVEAALGEAQCKLFLVRSGIPKLILRDAVETACRTFGMRHGFEDVGEVWVRTLGLQCGLQCGYIRRLGKLLSLPDSSKPTAMALLLDETGANGSASFVRAWQLLQDARLGRLSGAEALLRFPSDVWLAPFEPDELLRRCRAAEQVQPLDDAFDDSAYQYFEPPFLRWDGMDPILEYRLNPVAPTWRTSDGLTFMAEDPFRRERLAITDGRWQLRDGPVQVRITQRDQPGFRFRLMQGKEAMTDDWLEAGLPTDDLFVFLRASGAMVLSANEVPLDKEIVLLHGVHTHLAGLEIAPRFQMVLRGTFRLTQLRAGEAAHVSLLTVDGETLWSCPEPEVPSTASARPLLAVRGGKWGSQVTVKLPLLPFVPESLRLNSGELLPLLSEGGRVTVRMSPGLANAEVGLVRGTAGAVLRAVRVGLQHDGQSFGAAIETHVGWKTLDGSEPLEAAVLRTQRMRAQVAGPEQDVCWMEGSRTLSGLQRWGNTISGVHGLGERLKVVRGTYNGSQVQVYAASALTDGGFWRSVQAEPGGWWSASLPFEEKLEPQHALWVWAEGESLPYPVQRECMEKTGFRLRWRCPEVGCALGWAFSVDGTRLGSVLTEDGIPAMTKQLHGTPWLEAATWLRWWHAPVHHPQMRGAIAGHVRNWPVQTIRAWMLPARPGLIFDELRDEAWAAASREFLWGWRPDPAQAVDLVKVLGVWSGKIEFDAAHAPSIEAIGLLASVSPILLVSVAEQALPVLYPYPRPQLTFLLKLMLQAINPNAVDAGFRLQELYDRYARGESRLDGNFIAKRLVKAANTMLHGQRVTDPEEENLRIALHQSGLRQLIAVALLRDVIDRWEKG